MPGNEGSGPEESVVAQCSESIGRRLGVGVGYGKGDPTDDHHHAERRDKGRQLQSGYQKAVDKAANDSGEQANDHAGPNRNSGDRGHHSDGAAKRNDGSDGEVDPPRDYCEGHTNANEGCRARLQSQSQDVSHGKKILRRDRENDKQHNNGTEGDQPIEGQAGSPPPVFGFQREPASVFR